MTIEVQLKRTWLTAARMILVAGMAMACQLIAAEPVIKGTTDVSLPDLVNQTSMLVTSHQFAEALPMMQEIVARLERLKTNRNTDVIMMLEWARYQVGVCSLETGAYDEAVESFTRYLRAYPQGKFVRESQLLSLEALAGQEQWPLLAEKLPYLLREGWLTKEQQSRANQLLGAAYYQLGKWNEALAPLQLGLQQTSDLLVYNRIASQVASCLVRLDRLKELFEFLSANRTATRYDIGLNLVLIDAGDNCFSKGAYDNALILYRFALSKSELTRETERQLAYLHKQLETLNRDIARERLDSATRKNALEQYIASYEKQLETIGESPNYDQELVFRQARSCVELKRYWEALVLFRSIYTESPKHKLAQEALYSAFVTATDLQQDSRALAEGDEYVKVFPAGTYWDVVTMMLSNLHLVRQEYDQALAIAEKGLAGNPKHTLRDQVLFLMGVAYFHLDQFEAAQQKFAEVRLKNPAGAYGQLCAYWHALAQLFLTRYPEAEKEFIAFSLISTDSAYREDAAYRIGVAQYGASDFKKAADTFRAFLAKYPQSQLRADVYSLLGDIAGANTDLAGALRDYEKASSCAVSQSQINYAVFQSARVYELEQHYEEIIRLFQGYLKKYGEQGNVTEAAYWIGTAQQYLNRPADAVDTFLSTVARYGDKPDLFGIDMILRDLIAGGLQRSEDAALRRQFLDRIFGELGKARAEKKRTLELRLLTLVVETTREPARRKTVENSLLQEENLPVAAPITLIAMAKLAARKGDLAMARRINQLFLEKFTASDLALEPMKAAAADWIAQGKYDQALPLLKELITRFASTEEAGWAQKQIADSYRLHQKYSEAIEAYQAVLSVKEWRGPLWPESLYWIGICRQRQGDPREAFAYFQRIYVLYEYYTDWSAKAYLQSAECLKQLSQVKDAVKTYQEMLGKEALARTPEAAIARRELQRLGDG